MIQKVTMLTGIKHESIAHQSLLPKSYNARFSLKSLSNSHNHCNNPHILDGELYIFLPQIHISTTKYQGSKHDNSGMRMDIVIRQIVSSPHETSDLYSGNKDTYSATTKNTDKLVL
jgi:hypothetical protein